jgi:hypothetical protein
VLSAQNPDDPSEVYLAVAVRTGRKVWKTRMPPSAAVLPAVGSAGPAGHGARLDGLVPAMVIEPVGPVRVVELATGSVRVREEKHYRVVYSTSSFQPLWTVSVPDDGSELFPVAGTCA